MTHKPSNVTATTNLFSSACVAVALFFILWDNCKILFLLKVYCYSYGFFNLYSSVLLEGSVLKEVHVLHHLHNTSTMLIPKLENIKSILVKFS